MPIGTEIDSMMRNICLHNKTQEAIVLYIIRHGRTVYNDLDLTQGWCDSPLTKLGEMQADALGLSLRDVRFQMAFSSDLRRQKETAHRILAKNRSGFVPILEEDIGFRENNFGMFEGKPNRIMMEPIFQKFGLEYGDFKLFIKESNGQNIADLIAEADATHIAETAQQIKSRVITAIERIVSLALNGGGGNVLIVTSGGILRTLLPALLKEGIPDTMVENGCVSVLKYCRGDYIAEEINSLSYLNRGVKLLQVDERL